LQSAAKDDLNIRGAFWHMFGDAWVSFGVALSGLAILLKGWYIVDPIVSFAVVFAILKGAWPVLKESLEVLMESAPEHMDAARTAQAVREVSGVKNVHDVHVWAVKPGLLVFSGHVMPHDGMLSQELLTAVRRRLAQACKIQHITVQLETSCCHAEAHCDLGALAAAHQSGGFATMTAD
jgi:cobalt-zinc-cadmium efflux system protein